MLFKSDRIRGEWATVVSGKYPMLAALGMAVDHLSMEIAGKPAIVTGILRTTPEQTQILAVMNAQRAARGEAPMSVSTVSVHQVWRGIDFRSTIYTAVQRIEIIDRINKMYEYGRGLKTLALHRDGTAEHLHGQVPPGTSWGQK